ncbi:MAG: HD domain-containing protein [Deltaproteobacteria bacterium]|nr:HD domain-containing protein [Deltaproteobacteria bacterium]
MLDEETGDLYFEVAVGPKGPQAEKIRLRRDEGIVGETIRTGRLIVAEDVTTNPFHGSRVDQLVGFVTRNLMCVPLVHRDRTIGALEVLNKRDDRRYSENDRAAFEALAGQVAVSIVNARLFDQLQQAFLETVAAMVQAIEKRDAYTGGHSRRVTEASVAIGKVLELDEVPLERLRLSASLHDIGKLGVDDAILRKTGALTREEFELMSKHVRHGEEIVRPVSGMADVIPGILHHHERFDGKGYPDKLSGENIPLMARIICVADCYDAMTSDRPYRKRVIARDGDRGTRTACRHAVRSGARARVPRGDRPGIIRVSQRHLTATLKG